MVALLETYVRRVPGSPLLPAAVPPLLGALSRAARAGDDKALADRLQARRCSVQPLARLCAVPVWTVPDMPHVSYPFPAANLLLIVNQT